MMKMPEIYDDLIEIPIDTPKELIPAKEAKEIAEKERAKLPAKVYEEIKTHLMSRIPRKARARYAFLEHYTSFFKRDDAPVYVSVIKKIIEELETYGYIVEARLIDYNGANYKIIMHITWDLDYILNDENLTNDWKSIDKYNIIEVIKTDKSTENESDKPVENPNGQDESTQTDDDKVDEPVKEEKPKEEESK